MKTALLTLFVAALSLPTTAESMFTGEVLAGNAKQEFDIRGLRIITPNPQVFSDAGDDTAWGLRLAIDVTSYLEAELTYRDFGEVSEVVSGENGNGRQHDAKIETKAFSMGVKGIVPVYKGLSIVARGGVARWSFSANLVNQTTHAENSIDSSEFAPYFGLGFEYQINNLYSVGLEHSFMKFDAKEIDTTKAEADNDVSAVFLSIGRRI